MPAHTATASTPRPGTAAKVTASATTPAADDDARLEAFAAALNAIRDRVDAQIGDEDVAYIKKVQRFSDAAQWLGRGLIHISLDPITFAVGVGALWLHKQLEATEIGHTAMHGAFDKLPQAKRWHSKTYRWKIPIDEASWHRGHNLRHHQYTNIAGKDPDIHFGPVRLTDHTPYAPIHRWQVLYTLAALFPNFGFLMNMHFTGLVDLYQGNGRDDEFDFIEDRSWATIVDTHKRALRKFVPYYAKEYVLFPLLAGPLFWKVMLGNWLAEVMRDIYSAATIYCGHVGAETATYPEGTRASGRGQWYAMQVEAANNFSVPLPISQLCGALDLQIEHHLFPKFPTNRLRQIAPEVEAICAEHGVAYRRDTWPRTLRKALARIVELSRNDTSPPLKRMGNIIEAMA